MTSAADLKQSVLAVESIDPSACRAVTGFDGFVDEMISLVGERRSLDDYTPVPDIATFGSLVSASAGHSSLREIVVHDVHPGGCAVNLSDGLASLGAKVECFATLGEPVHPAYREIAAKCHGFHSWGREPGRTLAFEFNDGKLMFSSVKQLAEFTPDAVRGLLANGAYAKACADAQVIALTNWTLYPHMTSVWKMLQREVFSTLTHRPHFFIDLVDPSSRSAEDILEMAGMLRDFEPSGPLTLGLNGNEANILCRLHGLPSAPADVSPEETLRQASALRDLLGISRVVVHRIRYAVSASEKASAAQYGPYCQFPAKSTGAGDRFNAGFCTALAHQLNDAHALVLACAVSGFFVRNGHSATHTQLIEFMHHWADGTLDSKP